MFKKQIDNQPIETIHQTYKVIKNHFEIWESSINDSYEKVLDYAFKNNADLILCCTYKMIDFKVLNLPKKKEFND